MTDKRLNPPSGLSKMAENSDKALYVPLPVMTHLASLRGNPFQELGITPLCGFMPSLQM